jgi:hypothetical protein
VAERAFQLATSSECRNFANSQVDIAITYFLEGLNDALWNTFILQLRASCYGVAHTTARSFNQKYNVTLDQIEALLEPQRKAIRDSLPVKTAKFDWEDKDCIRPKRLVRKGILSYYHSVCFSMVTRIRH